MNDATQNYHQEFIELALECEVLQFGEFELKSGRVSPYFFNAGKISSGAAIARLGRCYAAALSNSKLSPDMLFGPAYKGIPLVASTATALFCDHGIDLPFAFNRKEVKTHGEGGNIIGAKLEGDVRWKYGTPPQGNANFGWIQHMLHHLNDQGSMALLLANGSMSSNANNEGEIRKALIENDLVECMVALPGQLFTNTQIPACIWFLTKDKANGLMLDKKKSDRRGKTLFIDARNLGYMKDRVLRDFTQEDIAKIADTFHAWQENLERGQTNEGALTPYQDIPGFCYSASLDDIKKHDFVLTPGRYVGAADQEEDSEPFAEKMTRLTAQLKAQFEESDRLEGEIKKNLAGIGYDV